MTYYAITMKLHNNRTTEEGIRKYYDLKALECLKSGILGIALVGIMFVGASRYSLNLEKLYLKSNQPYLPIEEAVRHLDNLSYLQRNARDLSKRLSKEGLPTIPSSVLERIDIRVHDADVYLSEVGYNTQPAIDNYREFDATLSGGLNKIFGGSLLLGLLSILQISRGSSGYREEIDKE